MVYRLLDITQPDSLYMGQKDFQQLTIIRSMLQQMNSNIRLVSCPILREPDGLAMSSRNVRLTPEDRRIAPNIYRTLLHARSLVPEQSPMKIAEEALRMLAIPGMEPEYFEIVDSFTLQPVTSFADTTFAVAATAVRLGQVRLIDNMILTPSPL